MVLPLMTPPRLPMVSGSLCAGINSNAFCNSRSLIAPARCKSLSSKYLFASLRLSNSIPSTIAFSALFAHWLLINSRAPEFLPLCGVLPFWGVSAVPLTAPAAPVAFLTALRVTNNSFRFHGFNLVTSSAVNVGIPSCSASLIVPSIRIAISIMA